MDITRRDFVKSLAIGTVGLAVLPIHILSQESINNVYETDLAKPSPQQLAWQDLELGLFIHFDMATFTGHTKPKEPADPNIYNPVKLDTDQWLRTAKAIGAKYAVFVAKHCSGFLSWQSNAYPYGVKQTKWRNGKGDVVSDFIASCKKFDIKPGLYASVSSNAWWGVDNPGVIKWGNKKQKNYVKACEIMLEELWSNYGELTEIWFDGGALPPEKGGPNLLPILEKYQPNAIVFQSPKPGGIRWIGNERGVADYPCWNTVEKLNDPGAGNPNGKIWNPGECDVPLPGYEWFWNEHDKYGIPSKEEQEETLKHLMDMYYKSVGRNCNLLLNATPDKTGLIPESILPHYENFGQEVQRRFGNAIAKTEGEGNTIEILFNEATQIDHVIIMEDIKHGECVRSYVIEGLVTGNQWKELCSGLSIGHKRIQQFNKIKVEKVRFRATETVTTPKIRRLAVFNVE